MGIIIGAVLIFLVVLTPVFLILKSDDVKGMKKALWVVGTLIIPFVLSAMFSVSYVFQGTNEEQVAKLINYGFIGNTLWYFTPWLMYVIFIKSTKKLTN